MTDKTFEKATQIKNKIADLQKEIKEFPRCVVDVGEYEKTGHKHYYIKRLFKKEVYKIRIPKGYCCKDLEFELSEEDLQALVDIRLRKVKELEKELTEL